MSIATSRPSRVTTGAVPHDRRMPLGRGHHVFHAIVDQLDRPARLEREQGRMCRDIGRILLLPAESSARLGLHDSNVRHGASQNDARAHRWA